MISSYQEPALVLGALTAAVGLPSVVPDPELHSSLLDFELAMQVHKISIDGRHSVGIKAKDNERPHDIKREDLDMDVV